jgi:ParB family chromosome partitioning protein
MEFLKLNELSVKNSYLRLDTDVSDLEKSIEMLGLIAPLVIDKDNNLLAGGRRYAALKNLGREEAWIMRVKGDSLQKELISIDENLVRKDLGKLELESNLRRAKELYTELLNHNSEKAKEAYEELKNFDSSLSPEENSAPKIEVLASQKFVKDVSEKTGMSHRQIFQAIERDEKASPEIKRARGRGDLSVGQTNEIIKLSKKEQKQILPIIKDKTVKEVRKLIKEAKAEGVEAVVNSCLEEEENAKEVKQLKSSIIKMSRLAGRIELENIAFKEDMAYEIQKDWDNLTKIMENVLRHQAHKPLHKAQKEVEFHPVH